jgi:hypothetical protein
MDIKKAHYSYRNTLVLITRNCLCDHACRHRTSHPIEAMEGVTSSGQCNFNYTSSPSVTAQPGKHFAVLDTLIVVWLLGPGRGGSRMGVLS